jgi:hypothetical protein
MEMTIESTDLVTTVDGGPVRLWRGTTAQGVACLVYVARLAVHEAADASQFEAELLSMPIPREVSFRETLEIDLGMF